MELTPLPVTTGSYRHHYQSLSTSREDFPDVDNEGQDDLDRSPIPSDGVLLIPKSLAMGITGIIIVMCAVAYYLASEISTSKPILEAAWSSRASPFSTIDPDSLGFIPMDRPDISKPGPIFGDLLNRKVPLPTNSWYENLLLGFQNNRAENKVFQVPYIIDTGGPIPGVRTHSCHVQANNRAVMMNYDTANGLTLGAVESFYQQHHIHSQGTPAISKLAIELEWSNNKNQSMRAPIVRGSPYTSMIYMNTSPRLFADRHLKGDIIVDGDGAGGEKILVCGKERGIFTNIPVRAERELRIEFDTSDMTWLVFLSEPIEFICSSFDADLDMERRGITLPPGVVSDETSFLDLKATTPMELGMVRIALSNNCTHGQNVEYCGPARLPRDQRVYERILRLHSDVYPTAKADIEFTFPVESADEEELRLIFNWRPKFMSRIKQYQSLDSFDADHNFINNTDVERNELLMFALPHHQERMRPIPGSSNFVLESGCMPTIHGVACPALGESWSLVEHLHRTSFHATFDIREEMHDAIIEAAKVDLKWKIPQNYMAGAGDTYFSGKLLARLSRVLLIAEEVGLRQTSEFQDALDHLRSGVEIWLNGSAQSIFLYDRSWGGLMMCGCDYGYDFERRVGYCKNQLPNCPALVDMGQNFGAGFYNDHHYHFGYHIYAAAVLSKFDPKWGKEWHQHVLLLVRDIANPSDEDPFFPTWRHKDWYLGFSWASGVVTIGGVPYPNGRNQESVSEAIAAYEAVALYGDVMTGIYATSNEKSELALLDSSLRMRDMGRLLMATEVRSAKTYWHVQAPNTLGVSRIYPDIYEPKVVGMIWSMLAQEQTWFGNEPWKSYGIQLLPVTVAAELRDDVGWVAEMLPYLQESCFTDPVCTREGWSIVIFTSMAATGKWKEAWDGVRSLDPLVFESAGGNGHSLTNTLWYIASRPPVPINIY